MLMKFSKTLFALALSGFVPCLVHAQDKMGTVDMNRAFSEYYKTKKAANDIQDDVAKARKEMNERYAVLQKLTEDLGKLEKELNDPVLSPEIKQKKLAGRNDLVNEAKSLERDIMDFQRKRQAQIQQQQQQARKGIYEEILVKVEKKSKEGGYDVVIDKSAMGLSATKTFLHTSDKLPDFTQEIIVELNRDAPAEAAPAKNTPKAEPATTAPKKKNP